MHEVPGRGCIGFLFNSQLAKTKGWGALFLLIFNFAMWQVQENQERLELNGLNQILVMLIMIIC